MSVSSATTITGLSVLGEEILVAPETTLGQHPHNTEHYLIIFLQVFRNKCNNTCLVVFFGEKLLLKYIDLINYNVLTPNWGSSGICICIY